MCPLSGNKQIFLAVGCQLSAVGPTQAIHNGPRTMRAGHTKSQKSSTFATPSRKNAYDSRHNRKLAGSKVRTFAIKNRFARMSQKSLKGCLGQRPRPPTTKTRPTEAVLHVTKPPHPAHAHTREPAHTKARKRAPHHESPAQTKAPQGAP